MEGGPLADSSRSHGDMEIEGQCCKARTALFVVRGVRDGERREDEMVSEDDGSGSKGVTIDYGDNRKDR